MASAAASSRNTVQRLIIAHLLHIRRQHQRGRIEIIDYFEMITGRAAARDAAGESDARRDHLYRIAPADGPT